MPFTPDPKLDAILAEIVAERERQDAQWGGPAHDDQHELPDWFDFVERQSVAVAMDWNAGRMDASIRKRLLNCAALMVAAIQSFDRKRVAAAVVGEQSDERPEYELLRLEYRGWVAYANAEGEHRVMLVAFHPASWTEHLQLGSRKQWDAIDQETRENALKGLIDRAELYRQIQVLAERENED